MEKRTLIGLCKEFLSIQGEDLKQFSTEYKKLTPKDKEDLIVEFAHEATVAKSI